MNGPSLPVISQLTIALPDWASSFLKDIGPLKSEADRMGLAIELSRRNVEQGTGGPFGAALFERNTGQLVAIGVNSVERLKNSVLHAEVVALMSGQVKRDSFTLHSDLLPELELHTSCEPCAMCLGAILWSGVRHVYCGAGRLDAGAIGFDEGPVFPESYEYLRQRGLQFKMEVLQEEAKAVLELYHAKNGLVYNG